ncbi:MAG: DUF362 domain-containing protein [Ardenticatenaceae bacterium]
MTQNWPNINRRRFLQATSLAALGAWKGRLPAVAGAAPFHVGVGHNASPYVATLRAIIASGDWNPAAIAGKRVIIKPNLVVPAAPESGAVTDPEVARAIADLSLQAGATEVWIVESGPLGPHFEGCGYGYLADYHPLVSLVDISSEPAVLTPVPIGLANREVWMPTFLFDENVYFISAAKMKVHDQMQATLSQKNMFGVPPIEPYQPPGPGRNGRFALHDRSVTESIVDLSQARPFDFGVVDAVWAMERSGPHEGDPVRMDLAFAGANPVAVDRVCLMTMGIPQGRVQHLSYATLVGLGPGRLADIDIRGDDFTPREFVLPPWRPVAGYPLAIPAAFNPSLGESTTLQYGLQMPCETMVEIVQGSPYETVLTFFRQLHDWTAQPAGTATIPWDGRDDSGQIVPPGSYGVRVGTSPLTDATRLFFWGWVEVLA